MSEPQSRFFRMSEWDGTHPLATPYPREWQVRWRILAEMLDVIREEVGRPVHVTERSGGYRNPIHNRAVKGARSSQHMRGRAADIWVAGFSGFDSKALELHALILDLYRKGRLPRLGGLGLYPSFVHVDTRSSKRLHRWTGTRTE